MMSSGMLYKLAGDDCKQLPQQAMSYVQNSTFCGLFLMYIEALSTYIEFKYLKTSGKR